MPSSHCVCYTDFIYFYSFQPGAEKVVVSLFVYMALDPHSDGRLIPDIKSNKINSITGWTEDLGDFKMTFPKTGNAAKVSNYLVSYAPSHSVLKEVLMQGIQIKKWGVENYQYLALGGWIVPSDATGPNYIVHQVLDIRILFDVIVG